MLVISRVSGARRSTQILKLRVTMLETKLNAVWARDVLMCTKPRTTQ